MTRSIYLTAILILLVANQIPAQSRNDLKREIQQIVAGKKATVGVSVFDSKGRNIVSLNDDRRFPMQSVFKLHIGLFLLSEIDKGKFSIDQKVELKKEDMIPDLYSPIRDKYPDGATLTIGEILEYTVAESDNVGCEFLLKMLGGPQTVENYFARNKFKNIAIKHNEQMQQANWALQFDNWTTPKAGNNVLKAYYDNTRELLSQKNYDLIWKILRETSTGTMRIKGELPEKTVVAHKTGSSGVNKATGVTAAVNDMGVVFLPNGDYFYITVFVTDSKEDSRTNEKIIADIAKASWDYFTKNAK